MIRDKKRYLLVESSADVPENDREFGPALFRELSRCIGESNIHRANLRYMKAVGKRRFILRSSLEGINGLVLALALTKRVNGNEMAFYTLKSSGTISALSDFSL